MEKEKTTWKIFKLLWCCDKFKQIRNDKENIKIRCNFQLPYENKFIIPLAFDLILDILRKLYKEIMNSLLHISISQRLVQTFKESIFLTWKYNLNANAWKLKNTQNQNKLSKCEYEPK